MGNRELIAECALSLFSAHGYDAVGIQDILTQVGVSKPTLYHYFSSKSGLLDAILSDNMAELLSIIKDAAEYKNDLSVTVYRVVEAHLQYAMTHQSFYRLLLALHFAPEKSEIYTVAKKYLIKHHLLIDGIFIKAEKHDAKIKSQHSHYASLLIGMIHTYVSLQMQGKNDINERSAFEISQQFLHGMIG